MGLLDDGIKKGLGAIGLGSINRKPNTQPFKADFTDGLVVTEYIRGRAQDINDGYNFTLLGAFMPHKPFGYGGQQKIVKDYYPGSADPVVQVLGPRENDTTIKGKFSSKRRKLTADAAIEMQRQVDSVRIRGNVLKIQLGEWVRWGFIEECTFNLNRLTDIEYEIKFSIVGFNAPKNSKIIDDDSLPVSANRAIIKANNALLASASLIPTTMDRSVSEFLNDQISVVAGAVAQVTGFVTGALDDAEGIVKSANRAVGLIRNARTTISVTMRRIGALGGSVVALGSGFSSQSFKAAATIKNAAYIQGLQGSMGALALLLASLQARYGSLKTTVPERRHLVRAGDTLQKIAIKYYNSAELWKNIYDHNKLTSTDLIRGSVLEIPKV